MKFRRIIAVDFSASQVPKSGADSIWVAVAGDGRRIATYNLRTRFLLLSFLRELLTDGPPTLVVIDVALGWPAGTAAALGLRGAPREAMGRLLEAELVDGEDNRNNRFAAAGRLNERCGAALFWGHPVGPAHRYAHLSRFRTRRPRGLGPAPVGPHRLVERHVQGGVKSPLQLYGNGAVGSQSLLAQLLLRRLARDVAFREWPFDAPDGRTVIGETYFSIYPEWRRERGAVRDEQQVRAAARILREGGRTGTPVGEALLAPLSSTERRAVHREEGWIVDLRAGEIASAQN